MKKTIKCSSGEGGHFTRTINIFKKNYKILIGILIGLIISLGGAYAATTIAGSSVTYSNSSSGLSATSVQDAIDELYNKTDIRKSKNFISAYDYQIDGFYKCITGEEDTCRRTSCYKKNYGSCRAGTIIKYKVNDTDIVTFHVMFDNGSTLTMQSQKNIINNTAWINAADYKAYNTDSTSCKYASCNDEGPMTVLVALERATNSWTNVNNITYSAGKTTFKNNPYTGCSSYDKCNEQVYTLSSRTAKARMITAQEASELGCTNVACPIWMHNYLNKSTSYGGTIDDNCLLDQVTGQENFGYWTMNALPTMPDEAYFIDYVGHIVAVTGIETDSNYYGARAVVKITKIGY